MKRLSDTYRPKNQADCDRINALRDAEAAHKIWMNTSVFTEAGRIAKSNKDAAFAVLDAAETAFRATQ